MVSQFEPVASSAPRTEVREREARAVVLQHSATRRRACNDVAWNPCQPGLLAVGLEKLPNETSLVRSPNPPPPPQVRPSRRSRRRRCGRDPEPPLTTCDMAAHLGHISGIGAERFITVQSPAVILLLCLLSVFSAAPARPLKCGGASGILQTRLGQRRQEVLLFRRRDSRHRWIREHFRSFHRNALVLSRTSPATRRDPSRHSTLMRLP